MGKRNKDMKKKVKAWAVVNAQFEPKTPFIMTVYFDKGRAEANVQENGISTAGMIDSPRLKSIPIEIILPN